MLAELGRMRGAAPLRKIGGRRQDMRLDAFQSPYAERTIRQQGNSQHNIEASFDYVDFLLAEMQVDGDGRILLQKIGNCRRDMQAAEGDRKSTRLNSSH